MAGDKDTLISMGFDLARVEWALKATGNRGLQPAMDHILENDGKPVPDMSGVSESKAAASNAMDVDDDEDEEALTALGIQASSAQEAKSIKCSDCGKIFKNAAVANFHAEKSGHDQFEESTEEVKPLTEEEKKEKLAELREKMAIKRAAKAKEQALDDKANEAIRRKSGKEMSQIKEDLQLKEAKKDAEQKKRDKIADAKARAAVKAQIAADKIARAEKTAREKAIRDGKPLPGYEEASTSAAPVVATHHTAPSGLAGKDYPETRLQIRLSTGGSPLTTTLKSDAPLREVAEFVASQNLEFNSESVLFATQFPRKQFSLADLSTSLRDLGLTPSAVLIASPNA